MRRRAAFAFSIILIGLVCVVSAAEAHLALTSPTSRYGGDVLKDGPCGLRGGDRSTNVVTLAPGATLTIQWDEYINHPGHYRIAFDDSGDDDFSDPPCLSDCASRSMVIGVAPGDYEDPTVLADGIEDRAGGSYSYEVTLPDVECSDCTLQVIQVMTDKPPYVSGGDDIYYQCIDLVLTAGGAPDGGIVMDAGTTPDAAVPDGGAADTGAGTPDSSTGRTRDDGGCNATPVAQGAAPLAALGIAFVVLGGRLRRRR